MLGSATKDEALLLRCFSDDALCDQLLGNIQWHKRWFTEDELNKDSADVQGRKWPKARA